MPGPELNTPIGRWFGVLVGARASRGGAASRPAARRRNPLLRPAGQPLVSVSIPSPEPRQERENPPPRPASRARPPLPPPGFRTRSVSYSGGSRSEDDPCLGLRWLRTGGCLRPYHCLGSIARRVPTAPGRTPPHPDHRLPLHPTQATRPPSLNTPTRTQF